MKYFTFNDELSDIRRKTRQVLSAMRIEIAANQAAIGQSRRAILESQILLVEIPDPDA